MKEELEEKACVVIDTLLSGVNESSYLLYRESEAEKKFANFISGLKHFEAMETYCWVGLGSNNIKKCA